MHSSSPFHATPRSATPWWPFLLCCFAVICGFRFFLIEKFGAPIAWGDDLDGIAHRILAQLHQGTFHWSLLFAAHNGDHVITATRLWEMLWYFINGEWDPKLGMMVKTPIYAAAMTIIIHLLTRGLDRRRFTAAAALTLLFAFPFNYHNLLWSFQSQFDFFFLTAALGWWALLEGRVALAFICAVVSPFTLGAGPILAASYVPFFLAAGFLTRTWSGKKALLLSAAAVAIAAFGASLPDGEHAPRTGTLYDKGATLVKLYAWPFSNLLSAVERLPESANLIPGPILKFPSAENSWMLLFAEQLDRFPILVVLINLVTAAAIVAPMALVAWLVWRKRLPLSVALGPLNVSVFAALMLAATAIARTDQPTIAMRFLDHVILAGFASIVACFILVAWNRRFLPWLSVWGLVLGFGYLATVGATMSQMANRRKPLASLEILQRYYAGVEENGVRRNNHAALVENKNFNMFIVSSDPTEFMGMLDDPALRPVLPRAITAPGSPRGWAADVASVIGKYGLVLAALAAMCAGWLGFRVRKRSGVGAPLVVPGTPA